MVQQSFGAQRPKLQDESISSHNYVNSVGSSHGEGIVRPFCLNADGSSNTPGGIGKYKLQNNSSATPGSQSEQIAPVTQFQIDQYQGDTIMNLFRLLSEAYLLINKY